MCDWVKNYFGLVPNFKLFCCGLSVTAAFVETVKAAEPLSTVLIGRFYLKDSSSAVTYMTLLPICSGVALSCYSSTNFDALGLLSALGSNVCFSGRAVFAKVLNLGHPGMLDETNLFFAISLRGLLFLIPITLLLEGRGLISFFFERTQNNALSNAGSDSSIRVSGGEQLAEQSLISLGLLLTLNGVMFACYNLASYIVLKRTDLVTHSVLNVFRRVFIIVATSLYFRVSVGALSMLGIALAVTGVLMFGLSRAADSRKQLL